MAPLFLGLLQLSQEDIPPGAAGAAVVLFSLALGFRGVLAGGMAGVRPGIVAVYPTVSSPQYRRIK